jgi:hypothetical protein
VAGWQRNRPSKLSGLASGALKLGKRLSAKGSLTPASLAGCKVMLTVQREKSGQWLKVTSVTRTTSASGTFSGTFRPAERGTYLIKATIAKTATHTAATTSWRTFKVK